MLVFLEYIFQFFINNALLAQTASTGRIAWANVFSMITLTNKLNVSCRGAIDNTFTFHVGGRGFDSRYWKHSFLFLFFFRKTYFHFLTNLKYTGRLIAGLLSAFIIKIL